MTETREEREARVKEKRKWTLHSRNPVLVYVHQGWVLAFANGEWALHRALPGGRTQVVQAYDVSEQFEDKAPFVWARGIIDTIQEKRNYKPFEEKRIHGRPGTENRAVKVPQSLKQEAQQRRSG